MFVLYGLAGCVLLSHFLKVPLAVSIPLLLLPLTVVIWCCYRPFPKSEREDKSQFEK